MKRILSLAIAVCLSLITFAQQQNAQTKPTKTHGKVKRKITPEERAQHKADLLKTQLQLNNDQAAKIKSAMVERNSALKVIREKVGENQEMFNKEALPIRKKFHDDLKKILTNEQFAKFKEMRKANRRADDGKSMQNDDYIDESELDLRKI